MKKIPIQVRLPERTLSEIDKSVKAGKFMNRSDFIRDSLRKPDEKKIDSLEKGLRNLSEHENPSARLLKIERKIDQLGRSSWVNFILLFLIFTYLLIFGGMLP